MLYKYSQHQFLKNWCYVCLNIDFEKQNVDIPS